MLGDRYFDSKYKSIMKQQAKQRAAAAAQVPAPGIALARPATPQPTDTALAPSAPVAVAGKGSGTVAVAVSGASASTFIPYLKVPVRLEMDSGHAGIGTFRATVLVESSGVDHAREVRCSDCSRNFSLLRLFPHVRMFQW